MLSTSINKIAKILALAGVVLTLYACGGSESNTSVSSNLENAGLASSDLSNKQMILTSELGRSDGENVQALTPEQLRREAESLAQFNKLVAEQENVKGFIVQYKDNPDTVASPNNPVFTMGVSGSNNALTQSILQTKVTRLNQSVGKHGIQLQLQANTVNNASVLSSNVAMTQAKAQEISAEILAQDSTIEYIEPDLNLKRTSTPSSFELTELWGLKTSSDYGTKADQVWPVVTGNGTVVAVLDTGYLPHEDLNTQYVKNNGVVAGYDFISNNSIANDLNPGRDADPLDTGDTCGSDPSSWHGTHVAGTIAAANNGIGITGMAYNAKILPVRVLGRCGGLLSDVAAAIVWAAGGAVKGVPSNTNPAKVINLSLGAASKTCSATMSNAIKTANSLGAVVVVAAGNDSMNVKYATPANCPSAVTVAATNYRGDLTWWTNYGLGVDVSAPGDQIYSTYNAGSTTAGADAYEFLSGTSMAAPHVAALYAMVFEVNQTLTLKELDLVVKLTTNHFSSDDGFVDSGGTGIIDVAKTVSSLTKQKIWRTKGDFNGDGISDLLWRNMKNGSTKISDVTTTALDTNEIFLLPNSVPYQDPMFRIEATADFNGDKKNDIVWRNTGTALTRTTTFNGRWSTGHNDFGFNNAPYIDRSYVALGVGDVDNDSFNDILWRNSQGVSFISFMFYSFEVYRTDDFAISPKLLSVGSADFNGDGFNDFVFQNKAGTLTMLYLSSRVALFESFGALPKNFLAVAVGDYNGDKDPDILLKNIKTGALAIMLDAANPKQKVLYSVSNNVVIPKNHTILAPGDYDGDGKDDVMTRNTSTTEITRFNVSFNTNNVVWSKTLLSGKVPMAYENKF